MDPRFSSKDQRATFSYSTLDQFRIEERQFISPSCAPNESVENAPIRLFSGSQVLDFTSGEFAENDFSYRFNDAGERRVRPPHGRACAPRAHNCDKTHTTLSKASAGTGPRQPQRPGSNRPMQTRVRPCPKQRFFLASQQSIP